MLAKISATIKCYRLPMLSGLLIGTSFTPFPPWAALFGFVPLWIFWLENSASLRRILVGGWLTGFILTAIGFNWIAFTVSEFGHFHGIIALGALLAFACAANLQVAITGGVWYVLRRFLVKDRRLGALLLPLLSALANAYLQVIFHWNFGYTFFWIKWPFYQLAELVGFQGLSSIVISINFLFLQAVLAADKRKKYLRFGAAIALFALLNFTGWLLGRSLPAPDGSLRVAIIQANIGNLEKQLAEKGSMYRDHIVAKYINLTKAALAEAKSAVDFIVWPETAFPATIYPGGEGDFFVDRLKRFVAEMKVPLVTGGYGYNTQKDQYTNSLYIVGASGNFLPKSYAKVNLLAFGEYLPFGEQFPILYQLYPGGDFLRGAGPHILTLGPLNIGPQICNDGLYPRFSVELGRQKAHVLLNVTNDSWFGTWMEPYQHMIMTFSRGVELRRPLIRSTNTGISSVSLADGTILEKSPLHTEWYYIYDVPYFQNPKPTIYQQFPWLMDFLFVSLILAVILKGFAGNVRKT